MPIFNRDTRTEYHVITCNHPFMIDAGMNSFTLPEFLQWWYFKDGTGNYANQQFFPTLKASKQHPSGIPANFIDPTPRLTGSYEINAWRFEDYNVGNYKKYKLLDTPNSDTDEWEYFNNNPEAPLGDEGDYTLSSLYLDDFTDYKFNRITKELEIFTELPSLGDPVMVSDLIMMNDYHNILGFQSEDEDGGKAQARKKLLQDIRRSKNSGYISWSGIVPITVNLIEGETPCILNETFVYKLYLFDKKRPADRGKTQSFPQINIAAPAIGPDGINNLGKVDGTSNAITKESPDQKVGGSLKTSFRSIDGKFSAGSEQIYGIVSSESIPGATFSDDLKDWAENLDIEEHFKDGTKGNFIVPGTGKAYPIDVQNANPFQWAPNYKNASDCQENTKEKVELQVFNMTTKPFNQGDAVILTDRYSLWFIDPLASSVPVTTFTPKEPTNWQFTYHMTNVEHHFRYADKNKENSNTDVGVYQNTKVFHDYAETDISKKYFHIGYFDNASDYTAWYNSLSNDDKDAGTSWPGYAQVTSFDFLGKEFAGLRPTGHALVLTNSRMDHKGNRLDSYNDYGSLGRARVTAPFFGCTFPDGYDEFEKFALYNGKIEDNSAPLGLSGSGFRPNTQYLDQEDSFFNIEINDKPPVESGVFDPFEHHNNISTNISPYYFITSDQGGGGGIQPSGDEGDQEQDQGGADQNPQIAVQEEPHVNIVSDTQRLRHLPADFCLNGPFSSENGGPQLNLNYVQHYLTNPFLDWSDSTVVENSFHDFWLNSGSFQWLWNTIDPTLKSGINDPEVPILDFKPINKSKVEFRPARDVLFAQFDPPQYEEGIKKLPYPNQFLNDQGFCNFNGFGSIAGSIGVSNYGGSSPLWSTTTKGRLLKYDGDGNIDDDYEALFLDSTSSAFPDKDKDLGLVMPFKYGPYRDDHKEWNTTTENWHAPLNIYCNSPTPNNGILGSSTTNRSRGAFSVIGARVTSDMDTGVQIKTNNYVGQPMWFTSNVFYASWGGRGLNYTDHNSTALYMKMYEAWPSDQTVYDARFFAVHHFNDGNKLQAYKPLFDTDFLRPWEEGYEFGELSTFSSGNYGIAYPSGTSNISVVNVEYKNNENQPENSGVPIKYDKSITNVDLRVPSFLDINFNMLPYDGQDVGEEIIKVEKIEKKAGLSIFKEGVVLEDVSNYTKENNVYKELANYLNSPDEQTRIDNLKKYTPLAPESVWSIDNNRRGRLLPWTYKKMRIGVPNNKIIDFSQVEPEDTLYNIVVTKNLGSIIVRNSGENYEIGEEFVTTGGNGSDIRMTIAATGENGNPTSFNWVIDSFQMFDKTINKVYNGGGYLPEDFANGEISGVDNTLTSPIQIIPATGTNRSFKAYFVAGSTHVGREVDFKPRIAMEDGEPVRVSAPDNGLLETGSITWRDTEGPQIIPIGGQALVLGDGTAFVSQPGLDNTDPTKGEAVTSVNVKLDDPEKANPNVIAKRYDMFFLMVSDMSHQWIESDGQPLAVENYIDMEIFPF